MFSPPKLHILHIVRCPSFQIFASFISHVLLALRKAMPEFNTAAHITVLNCNVHHNYLISKIFHLRFPVVFFSLSLSNKISHCCPHTLIMYSIALCVTPMSCHVMSRHVIYVLYCITYTLRHSCTRTRRTVLKSTGALFIY